MLLTQEATPEPSAQTLHRSLGPVSGCCVLYDEEKTAPSSLQASVRVDVGSEQWEQQQIQLLTVLSLQRVGTVHHQTQCHDVIFTVPGTGGAAPTMNKLCAIVPFLLFNRAPQNAGAHPALCTAAGQTNEICKGSSGGTAIPSRHRWSAGGVSCLSLAWIDPLWERRARCLRWAAAPLHCRQTRARKPDSQSAERYENPQSRFNGQSAECKFKDGWTL